MASRALTQILIKFYLQNLDQESTSKSLPRIFNSPLTPYLAFQSSPLKFSLFKLWWNLSRNPHQLVLSNHSLPESNLSSSFYMQNLNKILSLSLHLSRVWRPLPAEERLHNHFLTQKTVTTSPGSWHHSQPSSLLNVTEWVSELVTSITNDRTRVR